MIKVSRLSCESRSDPLGVDAPWPQLSWIIEATGPNDRRVVQSAYQIIVTSSHSARLPHVEQDVTRVGETHTPDDVLWDSGKVESSHTTHITYGGKPLHSAQKVDWRVRVWDADRQASEWSRWATWTMGLLDPSDWQAKWIAAPRHGDVDRLPIFRKRLTLERPVSRAMAWFSGLGQHELSVNEAVVGDNVLDPGWTDYRKTVLYATHDVTALLKAGDNEIRMMVGNGMYNVSGGRYVKFKGSFGEPKMILQMLVAFIDGTSTTIISDQSWETAPGPITFSCIYGGEDYDA